MQNAHGTLSSSCLSNLLESFLSLSHKCKCKLYVELWERLVLTKDIIIKILSKQDKLLMDLPRLVRKTIRKLIFMWRGRKWTHTFRWWTCANGKDWSQGTNEVLVIGLHMVGKFWVWFWSCKALRSFIHHHFFLLSFFLLLFFLFFFFSSLALICNTVLSLLIPHA